MQIIPHQFQNTLIRLETAALLSMSAAFLMVLPTFAITDGGASNRRGGAVAESTMRRSTVWATLSVASDAINRSGMSVTVEANSPPETVEIIRPAPMHCSIVCDPDWLLSQPGDLEMTMQERKDSRPIKLTQKRAYSDVVH